MRIIRSARGWATLTVGLVLALLIGTTVSALLATRDQQSHLESLEATSLYAGALESSRAEFLAGAAALAAVGFTQDQAYFSMYQTHIDLASQDLAEARAIALSQGRDTDVASVDDFIGRLDSYAQGVQAAIGVFLTQGVEQAAQARGELTTSALKLTDDLKAAVDREQALVSDQRAAAAQSADGSLRLQLILGVVALMAGALAGATLVLRTRQLEHNIERRRKAEEKIRHLVHYDALTNLPNRTLLEQRLADALAEARRNGRMLALLYLDLDRFKRVNDGAGHALGDQMLQAVVERLTAIVPEADILARVGGDEFTVLLRDISRVQDAVDVADRILEGLRRPLTVDHQEFHTTASMGIALYPNDAEEVDTLLRYADVAMYRAKEQGGDNYQLNTPTMNAQVVDRVALENDLRCALEHGELVVYYQPQVDITSERIVGVEALVRWQHPERGLTLPADFIPLAEESGLIVPLGAWVLRTACAQAKAWQEAGLDPIRVAVNLSARQFQQGDLMETVRLVLQETGLDPHYLQLEITESVAVRDIDFTTAMLSDLKEMGVQIAIDDFGTGHSSLNYLKRLPIDDVKIDRSFVGDLDIDPNDAAIVSSVIAMTHELNLKAVAEGVETKEQLAFLRERRCDLAQGFLFAKPMPADAVEKMIARGTTLQVPALPRKST
jgi:diguanylate cyclase (GGDEF)-like protein